MIVLQLFANGGAGRFKAHVLDEKPTAVTINFGMNDGGYGAFNPNANKTYVEKTNAAASLNRSGSRNSSSPPSDASTVVTFASSSRSCSTAWP